MNFGSDLGRKSFRSFFEDEFDGMNNFIKNFDENNLNGQ